MRDTRLKENAVEWVTVCLRKMFFPPCLLRILWILLVWCENNCFSDEKERQRRMERNYHPRKERLLSHDVRMRFAIIYLLLCHMIHERDRRGKEGVEMTSICLTSSSLLLSLLFSLLFSFVRESKCTTTNCLFPFCGEKGQTCCCFLIYFSSSFLHQSERGSE